MGFRYSGTAWDGQQWIAAKPIVALGQQVTDQYPTRPTTSDGTVASQGHDTSSPTSDHTPKPNTGLGVVRAIDITVGTTVEQAAELAEQLRVSRDQRIKYVIHKGRIFSSYATASRPAWEWGPYSGSNPHANHIHVSILPQFDDSIDPWQLEGPDMTQEQLEFLTAMADALLGADARPTSLKYVLDEYRERARLTNVAGNQPEQLAAATLNDVPNTVDDIARQLADHVADVQSSTPHS